MSRSKSGLAGLLLSFSFLYAISGCEPVYTSSYQVLNHTNEDLILLLYDSVSNDSISIGRNGSAEIRAFSEKAQAPEEFSLEEKDSVSISGAAGKRLKVYYPGAAGKNIFQINDPGSWLKEEEGSYHAVYSFFITIEDISEE